MARGHPFSRLLIANRGEIAVRIARTAQRMGIATVGVHSDTDRSALHVEVTDRSVSLGGATPAESYLRVDAVIDAARRCGADAIHPGYGFLAERADAAEAVEAAGLVWVGPAAGHIRLLGDKLTAKRIATESGVPTTPVIEVSHGRIGGGTTDAVPMPAIVKAAAGGGGRGMRVVRTRDELDAAVDSASREALAAFGDGTVFIEPYLEAGRHIEVQVFADHHGNVIHLGERECSIQRRNQKVLEEAPAVGIDALLRKRLCDGAVDLIGHVGYHNAATVEYLVGSDGTVTFLEVNTRLQVEHPVTEAVTGLDLVELQLRVAAGEPLPLNQQDLRTEGHAIEVRVVAENPLEGWLPSTGRLDRFEVAEGVRVDAGVRSGDVVSPEYDSLLAKVIVHAPGRQEAARRLADALARSWVAGVRTNLEHLVGVLREPDYLDGDLNTAYLDDHPQLLDCGTDDPTTLVSVAAVALLDEHDARRADPVWSFAPASWRNLRTNGARTSWTDERGRTFHLELLRRSEDDADLLVGAWPVADDDGTLVPDDRAVHRLRTIHVDASQLQLEVDGVASTIRHARAGDRVLVSTVGGSTSWQRTPRFVDHDAAGADAGPLAPLPGTVLEVRVEQGDEVHDGAPLVIIEAMKMEHTITAAGDGVIVEVRVAVGDRVDAGDLLVVIER